jgi:hypothetical protein
MEKMELMEMDQVLVVSEISSIYLVADAEEAIRRLKRR